MATSTHLRKIIQLLGKGSVEESIASAVVLGALAPKEKAAVDGLSRALTGNDNLPLALAAARALGKIGSPAALKALLPLLGARGELRETGALAIAGCGRAALPAVRRKLSEADFRERGVLFTILARFHTAEGLRLVLDAFFDPNFEVVKMAGRALRNEVPLLTPPERKAAARTALAFLKTREVRDSRAATSSLLIYLAALAQPESVPALLKLTGHDQTRATRRHALLAVRQSLQLTKIPAKVVETVFAYLDDPDYESVVEPALQILERASLPSASERELRRHLGARFPQVRQFAIRKLAQAETKRGVEILMEVLDGESNDLRQSALRALKGSSRAPSMLLPRLLEEKNVDRLWELVHAVKPQSASLTPAERKKLGPAAARLLDRGERRAEPLLHLFRHSDGKAYYKTFLDRAEKARRAKKYPEAERNLRLISKSQEFDVDARFFLALMVLKGGAKTVTPESPKCQNAVAAMERLSREQKFDLEARLKKENRLLGPDGLYTVGFALVHSPGPSRELGRKILKALVRKQPRTKLGRMARAKLQTEGGG